MAGLITGFAIVWAVNICIVKRKSFTGFDVRLPSTGEKKAGKEADDQKDQLIVWILWKVRETRRFSFFFLSLLYFS